MWDVSQQATDSFETLTSAQLCQFAVAEVFDSFHVCASHHLEHVGACHNWGKYEEFLKKLRNDLEMNAAAEHLKIAVATAVVNKYKFPITYNLQILHHIRYRSVFVPEHTRSTTKLWSTEIYDSQMNTFKCAAFSHWWRPLYPLIRK